MNIFEEAFDEAAAVGGVDPDLAKTLSGLIKELRGVEDQISDAEQHLKDLKAIQKRLSHERIPDLMDEMGVERLDVEGLTVSRRTIVSASIPVERKDEAHAWLRQEGLDDIIKNDVTLSFGRGEDNLAGDLVGRLREEGFDPSTKTHIHSSTLRAFVRERVEEGKPIDLDMFGAYVANAAVIKRK